MSRLTNRQTEVLDAIRTYVTEHGYPPTMRELADLTAIRSLNGVNDHLKALAAKGYIVRTPNRSRGIHLLVNEPVRTLVVDPALFGGEVGGLFFLSAPDDSLRAHGILRGDILFFGPGLPAGASPGLWAGRFHDRAVVRTGPPDGETVLGHLLGVYRTFGAPPLAIADTPSGCASVSPASA